MNQNLFRMIRRTTSTTSVFTSLSTNLTLLKSERVSDLLESGLDCMSISVDGFSQETYQRYRVGGQVQEVLRSIEAIAHARRQRPVSRPRMAVNMIRFHYTTETEIRQLESFCRQHGVDEFCVRPEQFGLLGPYVRDVRRRAPGQCHWPWTSMSIGVDGSVYACPIAFEQRISFGNLLREPLDDIWNNDLYKATRSYLGITEDIRESETRLPCYDCRWYGKRPATDQVAIRREWIDLWLGIRCDAVLRYPRQPRWRSSSAHRAIPSNDSSLRTPPF